jgi:hypothetical protein
MGLQAHAMGTDGSARGPRRRRLGLAALCSATALLVLAPAAQASFHLIKIREVFPGSTAHPQSGYVELQMYSAGENLVSNGNLKVYNSIGTVTETYTPTANVTHSANQSTVLIADSEYAQQFPSGPTPDFTDANLNLPASGAVCWPQTEPPFDDCASWGSFTGQAMLASTDTSPASPGGIQDGKAIRRSIAGGVCSTLLEDADDTNNSSVDFSEQTPNPRDNASPIIESECNVPSATIDSPKPAEKTNSTTATFNFHSTPAGAEFECKLDSGVFEACNSGTITYAGPLADGTHMFSVKAHNVNGTGAAATYSWTVDTMAPTVTIDTHPADPSSGSSPAFTYHSEAGSTYQCSLVEFGKTESFSTCNSTGKTFPTITQDGKYTFGVKAKDPAGNQGGVTTYTWNVDTSLGDKTPPETTLKTHPTDPTESATATFTYESNEPGSTFECKLDAAAFAACPSSGITYTSLALGPHAFQVVAIDPSNNKDPTPAGFSFTVVSPPPPHEEPPHEEPPKRTPDTKITSKPGAKTHDRTPTIKFKATVAGSTFQCKLDGQGFKSCRSPLTTKTLSFGRHTIKVRAVSGRVSDPTPAQVSFEVVKG